MAVFAIAFIVSFMVPSRVTYLAPITLQAENVSPVTIEEAPEWTFDTLVSYLAFKYDQDEKLARKIIKCESRSKMIIGTLAVVGEDVGYWQINSYYHTDTALKRGFDIYNWQGNLEYGFILLESEGTRPWNASKKCWNNT